MKHPTSKQVFAVVANFKSLKPRRSFIGFKIPMELDMKAATVNEDGRLCGTIHCHAGWYAVAVCNLKERLNYTSGVERLQYDLGFETYYTIEIWAEQYSNIWGNGFGRAMFSDALAFYHQEKRPNGAKDLNDIINHWQEVGERLLAMEMEEKKIVYKDITSELAVFPIEETTDAPIITIQF